ncbi:1713_t:CDS:2 [Funneliformis geosporum]|uniref:DNA-directed DNA polymerase n=1 Tax=Funneliformis geosporum TaxID=1117311 RepID=A0A9W4SKE2_9GLOM|nr:1713_t:CDS:2 [Funneliformis geosporum]
MTEKFKTKEEILKWKYHGKIGTKSENNFKINGKKKDTDKEGTIWDSGEKIEEKKDYLGAIKIKIIAKEDFFSSFLKLPDALHYQELLVKLRQINDYREVASIVHVSLFDLHYHANGMKIRNLLDVYTFKRDMVFSSRVCENIENKKYSGIYVFSPKKGIETRRSVKGLDFTSLYSSLIIAYNLFSDKIILTHEEADIAEKNGNILYKIEFLFNNCTIQAWSVRHDNQFKKKGLFPIILEDLFNTRVKLKAYLAH